MSLVSRFALLCFKDGTLASGRATANRVSPACHRPSTLYALLPASPSTYASLAQLVSSLIAEFAVGRGPLVIRAKWTSTSANFAPVETDHDSCHFLQKSDTDTLLRVLSNALGAAASLARDERLLGKGLAAAALRAQPGLKHATSPEVAWKAWTLVAEHPIIIGCWPAVSSGPVSAYT